MSPLNPSPNLELTFHKCEHVPDQDRDNDVKTLKAIVSVRIQIDSMLVTHEIKQMKMEIRLLERIHTLKESCHGFDCISDAFYSYVLQRIFYKVHDENVTTTYHVENDSFVVVDERTCDFESTLILALESIFDGIFFCDAHTFKEQKEVPELLKKHEITLKKIPTL